MPRLRISHLGGKACSTDMGRRSLGHSGCPRKIVPGVEQRNPVRRELARAAQRERAMCAGERVAHVPGSRRRMAHGDVRQPIAVVVRRHGCHRLDRRQCRAFEIGVLNAQSEIDCPASCLPPSAQQADGRHNSPPGASSPRLKAGARGPGNAASARGRSPDWSPTAPGLAA